MDTLLLLAILALNVIISIWNCYAVGSAWKDVYAMGGGFQKFLLFCGATQSVIGFSMPILLGLAYGSVAIMTAGDEPSMNPEQAKLFMTWLGSLWYVAIIFPALGTGFAITAHSLREAWRRRDFASIATAGWNTYAQVQNTMDAIEHLGGALGSVGDLFEAALGGDSDDAKAKIAILAIVLVVIALLAGVMITIGLIRYFASQTESRLEQYASANLSRRARA